MEDFSVGDFFDGFPEVIKTQAASLLDNIGIRIDRRTLPSWKEYEFAYNNWFGTHWLSRLWCQNLRRAFAPIAHIKADIAYGDARFKIMRELLNAVIESGKEL